MSSSTCNSILLKSSFRNNSILLNNFKTEAFYYIICKLGTNAHFPCQFDTYFFFNHISMISLPSSTTKKCSVLANKSFNC